MPSLGPDELASNWTGPAALGTTKLFAGQVGHSAFQAANWFFAVSLLVPHHAFSWTIFVSRVLMGLSFALATAWACGELCAPDVFAWNLLFTAATSVHVAYWSWRFRPARHLLKQPLLELYEKLFLPLDCPRELFVQLTSKSLVRHLLTGHDYFAERQSNPVIRLSVLLTGKLRVTFGPCDRLLHYVEPFQFIDSPEWYMAQHPMPDGAKISSAQVSIRAMEPSTYLQLDVDVLRQLMATNLPLKFLLDCLIGKDVSEKLYAVAEQTAVLGRASDRRLHVPGGAKSASNHSPLGPWQGELLRSQSADAVHTCTRGQVRSINWRRDQTRKVWKRRYEKLVPSRREAVYCRKVGKRPVRKKSRDGQVKRRESSSSRSRCDHIEEESDDVTQPLVLHLPGYHEDNELNGPRLAVTPSTAQQHQWCNKVQFGETFV